MIELSGIHVELGARAQRTHIHMPELCIKPGEIGCLTGRNGSGKTTLLRVMGGSISPTTGQVRITRPAIAVMDMERQFHLRMTAEENFVWIGRMSGLRAPESVLTREAFERAGISDRRRHLVGEFSKGQKVRLVLAILLAYHAETVLLDEPSNGLDVEGIALEVAVLRKLRDRGAAICMTSHDADLIRQLDVQVFAPDADNLFKGVSDVRRRNSHRVMKIVLGDGTELFVPERDLPRTLAEHCGRIQMVSPVGVSFDAI